MAPKVNKPGSLKNVDAVAKTIAAMDMVKRKGDFFLVYSPHIGSDEKPKKVWRDGSGKICCSCREFLDSISDARHFRCEHILAVKYSLTGYRADTNQPKSLKIRTDIKVTKDNRAETTENSRAVSARTERSTSAETGSTKVRERKMTKKFKSNQLTDSKELEHLETSGNVYGFPSKLRKLRKDVNPDLIKKRHGWRDSNGNIKMVDYVEWHTVADILDETTPNWTHKVKDIRQIGNIITVTVAITIDGITREGIGTGLAENEMGIKKAEHDALKRAAVKFGIARDLYKKESETIERHAIPQEETGSPGDPIAKSLADLVTAKQLGMIRAISRELGIDADRVCDAQMGCQVDELSKTAASKLIQHLQHLQTLQNKEIEIPVRRTG